MWYRPPQVAGYFYPEDRFSLEKTIESCFMSKIGPGKLPDHREEDIRVLGLVSPHAGYVYSGPIAAWGYLRLSLAKKPKTIIVLGPNHRGIGSEFAIFPEGIWETPLGEITVDSRLSQILMNEVSFLEPNEAAHRYEHSIEVQLPFLQYVLDKDFSIIPIVISSYDMDKMLQLGEAIHTILNEEILIIASSDFSHYIDSRLAEMVDRKAISYILNMDPEGFFLEVVKKRLSICGAGPITILLSSLREKEVEAKLLRYGNSGEITGDFSEVVAYASISFEEKI